jgi:hypothetical protein
MIMAGSFMPLVLVKPAVQVRDLQEGPDAVPAIGVFFVQVLVEGDRDPPCYAVSATPGRRTG